MPAIDPRLRPPAPSSRGVTPDRSEPTAPAPRGGVRKRIVMVTVIRDRTYDPECHAEYLVTESTG